MIRLRGTGPEVSMRPWAKMTLSTVSLHRKHINKITEPRVALPRPRREWQGSAAGAKGEVPSNYRNEGWRRAAISSQQRDHLKKPKHKTTKQQPLHTTNNQQKLTPTKHN